jgi:hypothetical protein
VLLEREFGGDYFKQYNEVERLMIADDWLKVEIFRPL